MGTFLEKCNPSVKGLAVVIGAVLLSFRYAVTLNLVVFGGCMVLLFACSSARKTRILLLLLPVLFAATGLLVTGLFYSNGDSATITGSAGMAAISIGSFYNGLQLATRVFAFAGLGLLFSMTTGAQRFITSLQQQAHLSPKFAYGILAALHLIPNIKAEFGAAQAALKARGVRSFGFSARSLFLVLVSAVRWSEMLAMAMESKGFAGDAPRTCYEPVNVCWYDWAFLIGLCGFILAGIVFLPY